MHEHSGVISAGTAEAKEKIRIRVGVSGGALIVNGYLLS